MWGQSLILEVDITDFRGRIVEGDLKELIGVTYTNKIHLLFDSPSSLKNFVVKRVWYGVVIEWVTFWKFPEKRMSKDKIC